MPGDPESGYQKVVIAQGAVWKVPGIPAAAEDNHPGGHARWATWLLALAGLLLSAFSVAMVARFFTPVHYWDQWEFVRTLARDPGSVWTIRYLFAAHNEHIIATSKPLFLADYALFGFTNRFLIGVIVASHVAIAAILARAAIPERPVSDTLQTTAAVFAAGMLSLVQWENLLVGFQTQFAFVILAAYAACLSADRFARAQASRPRLMFGALSIFATGCTIFSMGNGLGIAVAMVFLLIAYRRPALDWFVLLLPYAILAGLFFWLTSGAVQVGDVGLRTPFRLAAFSLVMLGAPFTADQGIAGAIGALFALGFLAGFVWRIALPWWRGQAIDPVILVLTAFAGFLFVTVAAAAWGRSTLGVIAATSSRYSTPVLALWLSVAASLIRQARSQWPWPEAMRATQTILASCLAATMISGLRPNIRERMANHQAPLIQASHFVLSGVTAAPIIAALYPDPAAIRDALEFLRRERLNIFAPGSGLAVPPSVANPSALPACLSGAVEGINRLTPDQWQVSGWAFDPATRIAPAWIVAFDVDGRRIGFSRPFVPPRLPGAPVPASATRERFLTPMRSDGNRPAALVALFGADGTPCRMDLPADLPRQATEAPQPLGRPVGSVDLSIGGAQPGHPPVPGLGAPFEGAQIYGTWKASDADTGTVTVRIDPASVGCDDLLVTATRGPTATGLSLQIELETGRTDVVGLDAVTPHRWLAFRIGRDLLCPEGRPRSLTVRLVDQGREWGAWAALAMPARPR
jgi:hypothetical protein